MVLQLKRSYSSCYGQPIVSRVDKEIFHIRYFTHCLKCGFCKDWCCSFGVCIDGENVARIQADAVELERYIGIPPKDWFQDQIMQDEEYPGGFYIRTTVRNSACVFLNRATRGCLLQSYSVENGLDYHELKPMLSVLFPITVDQGLLRPSSEVKDQTLVCLGSGLTLYRAQREELNYYFGSDLIQELDDLEAT